ESLEAEGPYLYCRVRAGAFRARFGRSAVQQLAPFLVEGGENWTLLFRGGRRPIRQAQPSPQAQPARPCTAWPVRGSRETSRPAASPRSSPSPTRSATPR